MDIRKEGLNAITALTFFIIMFQRDIRCVASIPIYHELSATESDFSNNELPQERLDQLKIPKDQTLIVRLPSNTLLKYNSYKDVSILHFRIPPDTRQAMFGFKAIEESKSAFQRKCKPRDVSLHLKASSYPVISPENITFPRTFLNVNQRGWRDEDINDLTEYGCRINFFKWSTRTLYQTIDLGVEGFTPLEIRFMHNPLRAEGLVGCALNAKVYYFKKSADSDAFDCQKVIDIPSKLVQFGDKEPQEVGGMISDIILSLNDRYLYVNLWRHGDVRQYDITDPENPKLMGQVFLGGAICKDLDDVKVIEDRELNDRPEPVYFKGRRLEGGPQMMQLSLDGKRLYVSTSLFSPWDKMFYPKMVEKGGHICMIDIDVENGGMKLNEDFFVDFGKEPYGPTLPHEMRYPGGDCTSDIWLAR